MILLHSMKSLYLPEFGKICIEFSHILDNLSRQWVPIWTVLYCKRCTFREPKQGKQLVVVVPIIYSCKSENVFVWHNYKINKKSIWKWLVNHNPMIQLIFEQLTCWKLYVHWILLLEFEHSDRFHTMKLHLFLAYQVYSWFLRFCCFHKSRSLGCVSKFVYMSKEDD